MNEILLGCGTVPKGFVNIPLTEPLASATFSEKNNNVLFNRITGSGSINMIDGSPFIYCAGGSRWMASSHIPFDISVRDFTISVTVRALSRRFYGIIMCKVVNNTGYGSWCLAGDINNAGCIEFFYTADGTYASSKRIISNIQLPLNRDVIIEVRRKNGMIELLFDKSVVASTASSVIYNDTNNTYPVMIGGSYDVTNAYMFDGYIGPINVYYS